MNKWVKRKWVRALRSGEYEQANGCLVDGTVGNVSYCCLGVLLAEMRPESIGSKTVNYYGQGFAEYPMIKYGDSDEEVDIIADDLATLFGLDRNTQNELSSQNDREVPFPVIADWIEENL